MGLCVIPLYLEWKLDEIRLAGKVRRAERFQLAAVFNHKRIEALAAEMDALPSPHTSVDWIRFESAASNTGCDNAHKAWRTLIRRGRTWSYASGPGSGRICRHHCAQAELPCWPPAPVVPRCSLKDSLLQ